MFRLKVLIFILGLAAFAVATAAFGATLTYPGSAGCNSTLQACIDAAGNGDVIQLATSPIDEDLHIYKSITIQPAPGHAEVAIGGGATERTIHIQDNQLIRVTLNQLALVNTDLSLYLNFFNGEPPFLFLRRSFEFGVNKPVDDVYR